MADARSAGSPHDGYTLFGALPVRRGHFLLESGYHTDTWLDLATLFVDPVKIAPAVTMLAGRLRRYACDAICGPMTGGAFLAQALAAALRVCFFYTEAEPRGDGAALFAAGYRLPGDMMVAAEPISAFVNRHPTVKMLALSFLLLIGLSLLMEGFDQHIPKGYIYFAMGFSVFVEMINLRVRKKQTAPVHLRQPYTPEPEPSGRADAS